MNSFILAHKRKKSESSGGAGPLVPDLVTLGILTKPIAEFSNSDIGTTVLIPYTDPTGKFLLNDGKIEFEVVGVNHHKDTNNVDTPTITLMTKNIIRLAIFDVQEPGNPDSDRKNWGNGRWSVSNIRQWLNSSEDAGSWFKPQHDYDASPTATADRWSNNTPAAYADEPGFLKGFSADVLQHFTDIENTTALCNKDGGDSEKTTDKVFLPSLTEMFGSNNNGIAEGTHLSLKYKDASSRIKQWNGSNDYYWMRSPFVAYSFNVKVVSLDGYDNVYRNPYLSDTGIAPIIVLH